MQIDFVSKRLIVISAELFGTDTDREIGDIAGVSGSKQFLVGIHGPLVFLLEKFSLGNHSIDGEVGRVFSNIFVYGMKSAKQIHFQVVLMT